MAPALHPPAGAAASRTQPSDLLIVQRGATPYKATAEQLKSYMLTPATAAAIGAIKPGTNLSVDADGTLHAAIPGALTYRGAIDPPSVMLPLTPWPGMCTWPAVAARPWRAGAASPARRSPRAICCCSTAATGVPTQPWAPMAPV